jgi:probable HAF family extracellular repeat protein
MVKETPMARVYPSLLAALAAVGVPVLVLAAVFLPGDREQSGGLHSTEAGETRRPVRALPSPAGPPAVRAYTLSDLGAVGSRSYAISAAGHVVGQASGASGFFHAFLYQDGALEDVGTLGYPPSLAQGVNGSGQVVGWSATPSSGNHAFLYWAGVMQDLGTLGGDESEATAINERGQIVGGSRVAGGDTHAFLYSAGRMADLGTLGGSVSKAWGINDAGEIVGGSDLAGDWTTRAFLYRDGVMRDRGPRDRHRFEGAGGTLGGRSSKAYTISDAGHVVGCAETADEQRRAFFYRGGRMIALPGFGSGSSGAWCVNNRGEVVGGTTDGQRNARAFYYRDGVTVDLNRQIPGASGWVLHAAYDINDAGQIVGWGTHCGRSRAFLLTPE